MVSIHFFGSYLVWHCTNSDCIVWYNYSAGCSATNPGWRADRKHNLKSTAGVSSAIIIQKIAWIRASNCSPILLDFEIVSADYISFWALVYFKLHSFLHSCYFITIGRFLECEEHCWQIISRSQMVERNKWRRQVCSCLWDSRSIKAYKSNWFKGVLVLDVHLPYCVDTLWNHGLVKASIFILDLGWYWYCSYGFEHHGLHKMW